MRLVDVGNFRLHVRSAGASGPTVVFDAALAGSSISWTYVQPAVARFTRTLAYDRAGLGRSEAGPMPRTAGRAADELARLLTAAAVPPPYVIVGHSFGGLVSRIFAARYRPLVSALVLVDPAHPEDWLRPAPKEQARIDRGVALCRRGVVACRLGIAPVVAALVGAGAIGAATRVVDVVTRGGVRGDIDWLLAPLLKLPPDARRELRSIWTRAKFFEALGSQIAAMPVSAAETLEAGTAAYRDLPLVTMSSTDPGDHRLRQQDALAASSRVGRHLIASNSGHWIPLDQPELVVAVIERVVQDLRGREGTA